MRLSLGRIHVTIWLLKRLMLWLLKGKMRTIILTYPGFQSLPKGVKQMLVASENFFFGDAEAAGEKIAQPNLLTRPPADVRGRGFLFAFRRKVVSFPA